MAKCRHYEVCGREAGENAEDDLCILHSHDPAKDKQDFEKALAAHRVQNGHNFRFFVFPEPVNFQDVTFSEVADFSRATFADEANFSGAKFTEGAEFREATFNQVAHFTAACFGERGNFNDVTFAGTASFKEVSFAKDAQAHFRSATFTGDACFVGATFEGKTYFSNAKFSKQADFCDVGFAVGIDFSYVTFTEGALFDWAWFSQEADFGYARFLGRTIFAPGGEEGRSQPTFSGTRVDFKEVIISPVDALTFRDVDLSKCMFQGTDLRKVEITGATWAVIPGRWKWCKRYGVYDEICPLQEGETRPWHHIERVYRELKQNYEDRRDYLRAGDFHYGEKEMRRNNPKTSWGLRFFLALYRYVGGYGERWLSPLFWSALVLVSCALLYCWLGLSPNPKGGGTTCLHFHEALVYSLRVMFLLKPDEWVPAGNGALLVNTLESVLGPLLIGLFALALRQNLKR